MSRASEYAANASRILQAKGDAIAQGHLTRGNIIGSTIATLGQVIPQQVQEVMKRNAEKRKTEQIHGILGKYPNDLGAAANEIMAIDRDLGTKLLEQNMQAKKFAMETAKFDDDMKQRKQSMLLKPFLTATTEDEWDQARLNARVAGVDKDIPYASMPWSPDLPKRMLLDQMSPEKRYEALYAAPKAEDVGPLEPVLGPPGPDGQPTVVYGTRRQAVGTPIPPKAPTASGDVNPGSFEDYVIRYAKDKGKTVEQLTSGDIQNARKLYQQADDRPIQVNTGGEGSKRWAKDPKTGDVRLMTDAEVMRIGATQPDTADMRNKAASRAVAGRGIEKVKELGTTIFTKVGPAQRADAIRRGAAAVFGNDPGFRTYQDARMATAGALAVEQQGSRVSDADVKALWLPMIPDAYSDTKDSYKLKWELIDAMRGIAPPAPPPKNVPAKANPFRK